MFDALENYAQRDTMTDLIPSAMTAEYLAHIRLQRLILDYISAGQRIRTPRFLRPLRIRQKVVNKTALEDSAHLKVYF